MRYCKTKDVVEVKRRLDQLCAIEAATLSYVEMNSVYCKRWYYRERLRRMESK